MATRAATRKESCQFLLLIIPTTKTKDSKMTEIQEHFNFVTKIFNNLKAKYPNDEYLISLENEENMQIIKCSFDWYKKYGIEK